MFLSVQSVRQRLKVKGIWRIFLSCLLVSLLSEAFADSIKVPIPHAPLNPTNSAECNQFSDEWNRIVQEINKLHSECISSPGCKGGYSDGQGLACSCARCVHLHGFPDEKLGREKREEMNSCFSQVRTYENEKRNASERLRQLQAESQRQRRIDEENRRKQALSIEEFQRQQDAAQRQYWTSKANEERRVKQEQQQAEQLRQKRAKDNVDVAKGILGLILGPKKREHDPDPEEYDATADAARELHKPVQQTQSPIVNKIQNEAKSRIDQQNCNTLQELERLSGTIDSVSGQSGSSGQSRIAPPPGPNPWASGTSSSAKTSAFSSNPWANATSSQGADVVAMNPRSEQSSAKANAKPKPVESPSQSRATTGGVDYGFTSAPRGSDVGASSSDVNAIASLSSGANSWATSPQPASTSRTTSYKDPTSGVVHAIPSGSTLWRDTSTGKLSVLANANLPTREGDQIDASGKLSCSASGKGVVIVECERRRRGRKR
jgi:hypothetical protein